MRASPLLAITATISTAYSQIYQGFNYGSVFTDNSPILQQNYQDRFNTAKQLQGTSGFTSARLFTMIQAGTTNSPTQAIPAAIATRTSLLLGLFLSSTDDAFNNELAALISAISTYGQQFVDLIVGISVGSEDLYRISPTGIENLSGAGDSPDQVVSRINAVRERISGTIAKGKPVGHVDTWTAYVNGSNSAVIEASDFVGMDAYPYFQTTQENSIGNSENLFFEAYNATVGVSGGKPVWITETGFPVSGKTSNLAVPSLANAKTYWDQVGCRVFGSITTFWYTLQDAFPNTPNPSFGIVGSNLGTTPLYDLSCPNKPSTSSPNTSSSSSTVSQNIGGGESDSSATASEATPQGEESTAPSAGGGQSPTPAQPEPTGEPAPSPPTTATQLSPGQTTLTTVTTGPDGLPTVPASSCPTSLSSDFQYPHLIVGVDKSKPDTAFDTSYNAHISPTVSSIFNFDIPTTYSGRDCALQFLFPTRDNLQTSNYTLSGSGGINVARLASPATSQTTYNNKPAVRKDLKTIPNLQPGNSYFIAAGHCSVGERISYQVSATGDLDLDYFQDYNPSPLGLFISLC
ncbi:MAG: hypothetical protein LQ342_008337 [Letrouitia transgressa]|nr:MAG: hypothetical protein LQ342_008337 [Letrouitia transgressa]